MEVQSKPQREPDDRAYMGLKMDREDLAAVRELAARERTTRSAWIRKAILDRIEKERT